MNPRGQLAPAPLPRRGPPLPRGSGGGKGSSRDPDRQRHCVPHPSRRPRRVYAEHLPILTRHSSSRSSALGRGLTVPPRQSSAPQPTSHTSHKQHGCERHGSACTQSFSDKYNAVLQMRFPCLTNFLNNIFFGFLYCKNTACNT